MDVRAAFDEVQPVTAAACLQDQRAPLAYVVNIGNDLVGNRGRPTLGHYEGLPFDFDQGAHQGGPRTPALWNWQGAGNRGEAPFAGVAASVGCLWCPFGVLLAACGRPLAGVLFGGKNWSLDENQNLERIRGGVEEWSRRGPVQRLRGDIRCNQ